MEVARPRGARPRRRVHSGDSALPRVRAPQPRHPQPLRPPPRRAPAPRPAGRARGPRSALLLPRRRVHAAHLRGAVALPRTARMPDDSARDRAAHGRDRSQRGDRRASARAARDAGQPRHPAAPRAARASAGAHRAARGGRRRLGDAQGHPLRLDRRRPRGASRRGRAARSHRADRRRVARAAPRRDHGRARPLARVRAGDDPRRAARAAGRRPLAPAPQRPADGRTVADGHPPAAARPAADGGSSEGG